jgi:hypothetical protein
LLINIKKVPFSDVEEECKSSFEPVGLLIAKYDLRLFKRVVPDFELEKKILIFSLVPFVMF